MIALMILSAATVYLVIGSFIVKRISNKWGKRIAIAVLILIPTGDAIVGRIYLGYLCNTEAGVKVYQTVELPAEYWDAQGRPRFFNEHGYPDRKLMADKLDGGSHSEHYPSIFAIDKNIFLIKEKSSQRVLAETTTFLFWGGWVARNFSLIHNTAASCEFMDEPSFNRNLYGQLFKPATSTK